MKTLILTGLLFSSFSAFANVYCQASGEVFHVLSAKGFRCNDEFFSGGAVCFTGSRAQAIKLLNSEEFQANFAGTDGESIGNAHFKGKDAISYDFIDLANEYVEKMTLNRCDSDFFKR